MSCRRLLKPMVGEPTVVKVVGAVEVEVAEVDGYPVSRVCCTVSCMVKVLIIQLSNVDMLLQ